MKTLRNFIGAIKSFFEMGSKSFPDAGRNSLCSEKNLVAQKIVVKYLEK